MNSFDKLLMQYCNCSKIRNLHELNTVRGDEYYDEQIERVYHERV